MTTDFGPFLDARLAEVTCDILCSAGEDREAGSLRKPLTVWLCGAGGTLFTGKRTKSLYALAGDSTLRTNPERRRDSSIWRPATFWYVVWR
jgi:hypothetical protein